MERVGQLNESTWAAAAASANANRLFVLEQIHWVMSQLRAQSGVSTEQFVRNATTNSDSRQNMRVKSHSTHECRRCLSTRPAIV